MENASVRFLWLNPWLMWFLPSLFFAYQFIVRIIPGLVMPELMQKFQIDATSYGFFASVYYVGYAGMQIPIALLLDRLDPKKIISFCAFLTALGTIVLVYSNNWLFAVFSRFLIGVGSAVGFLGTSKMVILWFKPEYYPRMMALNCTIGLMGAVYCGKPVSNMIASLGWEKVLFIVGLVGLAIAFLLFLFIRNPSHQSKIIHKNNSIFSDLKKILKEPRLIIAAFANLLMVGALEGFADVWGISYFMVTREISKTEASTITSAIFLGMVCGGPILAYLSDKFKALYGVTSLCGLSLGFIFLLVLFLNPYFTQASLYGFLFIAGILCGYQVLVFSIGTNLVSAQTASVAVAFLNCINMLGGTFFHGIIGHSLDFFWTGNIENNLKIYSDITYTYALLIIPITAILGGLLFAVINPNRFTLQFLKKA